MLTFSYPAVCVQQSKESNPLILFGAPAVEIECWAGIPQKKSFNPELAESTGFQRTENKKRLEQLERFFNNKHNVIQNSLICGLKKIEGGSVEFFSENGVSGDIVIKFPDLYKMKLVDLFDMLKKTLYERIGEHKDLTDHNLIDFLKSKISLFSTEDEVEEIENDSETDEPIVFEESHLEDFLKDVIARHEILKEITDDSTQYGDSFLGFDRNSLLSFLLPITLVDGQHRLKGAIRDAYSSLSRGELRDLVAQRISDGDEPEEVEKELLKENSRFLPISLLMDDDPKEQVFQFVVINQKATPIVKSLLGTIISTSLTTDEMDSVSGRLKDSGIVLDDARAITWAARNPSSPFYELVERGLESDKKDLLQWNVMGSLIQIFRELKGGCLFHARNDYAKSWKDKYLAQSNIVSSDDIDEAFEEWRSLDGIWRDVFIVFWNKIRSEFSQGENPSRFNYWGNPRRSNLFNKISLTILAADFFKYISVAKKKIDDLSDIEPLMDEWLEDVNREYFDRDWELSGVKKDSTGIRSRWSENWADYRENPETLPQVRTYRNPKK
ncbi:hypothetical protein [Vibrio sp. MEBiC08052]|uniref:hypothetical protein n=1 Tax=Vibrio sp. MEBiC08052 TaxID=1761910 RepID=UPI000740850F|nr:hypothetical protein [Vibrio sp. MEBiC08052]KUJ00070.1 hypothetical protein VRK_07820 [Vibrio sp. MEBiC08052]